MGDKLLPSMSCSSRFVYQQGLTMEGEPAMDSRSTTHELGDIWTAKVVVLVWWCRWRAEIQIKTQMLQIPCGVGGSFRPSPKNEMQFIFCFGFLFNCACRSLNGEMT